MPSAFKSVVSAAIGTAAATLYTAPAATTTTVIGLAAANTSAAAIKVDVKLTKGAVSVFIVKGVDIPVGTSVIVVGGEQKLVVETGDTITVTSSAATSCDAIASVLELT